MKYIIFVLTFIFCLGCSSVIKEVYGVNKNKKFNNINEYTSYINENYNFSTQDVYYANDESVYNELVMDIITSHTNFFYGIYINDSIRVKKTDFLKENESCRGRILKEISNISEDPESTRLEKTTIFKDNLFKNIVTNKPLNLNTANRKKVILVFSYKLGTLLDKDFKEIKILLAEKKYDLYIISVDRIHDLKF